MHSHTEDISLAKQLPNTSANRKDRQTKPKE